MIKPSNSVIKAIIMLENNVAWKEIVEWIDNSLTEQSIANNKSSGEDTIKNQGRNLELEDLKKHIVKARIYNENALNEKKRVEEMIHGC